MFSLSNKIARNPASARSKWLILLMALGSAISVNSQNLNTPNKKGPLGTSVNTLSGNVFIPRTDIYVPARGFDLNIRFYYNSYLFTEQHGFGRGWTFEYNIKYSHDTLPGGRLILWGDGREDKYDSLPGGTYKAPKGFFARLVQHQPGQYVLVDIDSTRYFFNNPLHKRITRMEEPNGNYINFTYADSLLTAMTNTAGQSVTFTYNAQGRLATVVDAIAVPARTYTYTYDAGGNLKEVKDPLNGKCQYSYLVNGPMKSITDKNNNKVDIIYSPDMRASELVGCNKRLSFAYDTVAKTTVVTDHLSSGNQVTKYTYQMVDRTAWLTSVSGNCCGFNVKFEYDEQGNITKMTDANGQVYKYTFNAYGNMLTATDPLNQFYTYTYSADFHKVTSYTDPKGNVYTMSYNGDGNMTQMITPGNNVYSATYNALGDILTSADPRGNSYTYNYDAYGNPTHVTGPNNYSATLSYDARGNLLSYTDAGGNNTTGEYDILDRLKKITDPINNFTQFGYDAEGNMTSIINKNNEASQLNYDASNRLVKVTGPTGNQTRMSWDGMDNLTAARDALGYETKYNYDSRNRVKESNDAGSNKAIYNYDANGNMTSINLPNGRTINYTYDQLNRLKAISDGSGTIASYTYDQNSNIISYANGTGATTTVTYDSLNRIKKVTDPLGNSRSYTYDKNSNTTSVTDKEGHTRHYTYDSLDRVKTYTDNNGFVITAGYDGQNNVVSLTDQNNHTTTYTYDSLNRRKTMTYPDGKYMQYAYDKKGNVTSVRLTDGAFINYVYDTLNRVISRTLPGGDMYSFTYDKMNRVLTATNSNGTVTFAYDNLNRIISESFDGRTTRFNYNIAGRTQTITYPDSTVIVKEYDQRNRLARITKNGITVVEYEYNNANQLTSKTFANGVKTLLQYDFANRLTNISTSNGTIQNTSFTYDKEMNKTAITRSHNPSLSEQFTYDNGYRLISYKKGPAGSPVLQNIYTYDPVGNRTAANLNGTPATYNINNLNQVTGVNSASFTFDDRGNITFDGTFYKTYDADNRLKKDSASPANVLTYGYDAMGRRIVKTINGVAFKYTYSGAAPIEERNASNVLLNRTIFTSFLAPVLNEKNGNGFYYHASELNSVEAITNSNGRLVESYQYNDFGKFSRYDSLGNPLASSIAGNRFGFTGQEYDSASGSYRFFFRNYSAETGVFNQRDMLAYKDGMGMYQYVGNNPANGVDIWGLECSYQPSTPEETEVVKTKEKKKTYAKRFEDGLGKFSTEGQFLTGTGGKGLEVYKNDLIKTADEITFRDDLAFLNDESDALLDKADNYYKTADDVGDFSSKVDKAGKGFGYLDNLLKAKKLYDVGNDPNATASDIRVAGGDMMLSVLGHVPSPVTLGYSVIDYTFEKTTGVNLTQGSAYAGEYWGEKSVTTWYDENQFLNHMRRQGRGKEWLEAQERMEEKIRNRRRPRQIFMPSCYNEGGTRTLNDILLELRLLMAILRPIDPNEIIGPEGQPNKKWVSIKDRMPYTILFENDSTATARTRYIKITTPVEPKQDAATLELGNFGFNNQSFEIPAGTSSYYQRLDTRDSTGVYVDITAGYDVISNQVFWEFQAIDPLTLLPPEDPLAGFLFLQDTAQPSYGNGFVNFSMKPITSAQTLDTIGARAFIVFDSNDTIPTNIHTNTIDALPPTSSITNLPGLTPDTEINLTYTGADDPNGSGVKWYSIYVSDNNGAPELYVANFTRMDTTFRGLADHSYKFYVSATDTAGNIEMLRLVDSVSVSSGESTICPDGDISFDSKMGGTTFQWQVDNGTGFVNVPNGGMYSGANTSILSITGASTSMYGYKFRCLVNGSTYSELFLLKFGMTWEGTISTAWENPANWSCGSLPDDKTDVIINGGKPNYPVVNSNVMIRTLRMNPGATGTVNTGFSLTVVK